MTNCPVCNASNEDGARFCGHCAAPLTSGDAGGLPSGPAPQPQLVEQHARPRIPRRTGAIGAVALAFGIIGLTHSWIIVIPYLIPFGWLCCLIGLIFGIAAAASGRGRSKGVTGLVLSLITPTAYLVAFLILGDDLAELVDEGLDTLRAVGL